MEYTKLDKRDSEIRQNLSNDDKLDLLALRCIQQRKDIDYLLDNLKIAAENIDILSKQVNEYQDELKELREVVKELTKVQLEYFKLLKNK